MGPLREDDIHAVIVCSGDCEVDVARRGAQSQSGKVVRVYLMHQRQLDIIAVVYLAILKFIALPADCRCQRGEWAEFDAPIEICARYPFLPVAQGQESASLVV